MLWLKNNTYFARAGSGRFLLSCDAPLRLDETVPVDVVDSVISALTEGRSSHDISAQLAADQRADAWRLIGILADEGLLVAA